jgi:hypothetical protein
MANERLYQFPSKASPVPADIIYCGDSAAAFDEVNITIAALIGAYPNLSAIGGLTIAANTFIFSNSSAVITTAPITALAVSLLADTTAAAMQDTIGYTATPTASQFAGWDANVNLSSNAFISAYATTATAASTTTLTVASKFQQFFTGTTTQTVLLPVTSTLVLGQQFYIVNNSTGVVTVESSGGNTVQAMAAGTTLLVTCILTSGTSAASWYGDYSADSVIALPLSLANGGTNAALSANAGAVVCSSASAFTLTAVGSSGQLFISAGTSSPGWTTSTYPTTNAANTLLYASSANTMAALATANNGVLITSSGGVPSISSTLPSAVQTNITALGAQAQALNMNSHLINNVTDPASPQDAATRNYVDQNALNGTSVYAASTGTLGTVTQSGAGPGATITNAGAQATFALDSVNPPVGTNVLIKNTSTGATAANEGVYTVTNAGSGSTNWVLTRATNFDTAAEINTTGLIVVQNGATLAGTAWYNAATIVTVDTTNFSFSQFGSSLTKKAITEINRQYFTSGTSTYTPTTGTQYCFVQIVAGGGGSGGAAGSAGQLGCSGGGGGGGYSEQIYTAALLGASATVVVGSGGAAGSSGANAGGTGGTSSFTPAGAGATLTCTGGLGGAGSASSATQTNANGNNGGSGSGSTNGINITGGNGSGGLVVLGSGGYGIPGAGGGTPLAVSSFNYGVSTGTYAQNYGAGGSGTASGGGANVAGQAGAPGLCIVTEYISV